MFRCPQPVYTFAREGIEWFGNRGESPDESAVEIAKTEERTDVLNFVWRGPVPYGRNFDGVHACHPLFKDYPQVIDTGCVENALFRFEVEIVIGCKLKYVGDSGSMIGIVGAGSYGDIIHVDANRGTKEFVLSYDGTKDMIHHGLESSWQVCETEEHDGRFVQAVACFKRCLVFISLLDAYVVIPPLNVEFGVYVGPA